MTKIITVLIGVLLFSLHSAGQTKTEKIIYFVDSIPYLNNPVKIDDIAASDISEINVLKNKETLKLLGFEKYDGAIYIFTKEYRRRSQDPKQVPSSKQTTQKSRI